MKFALVFVLGSFSFGAPPERQHDGDRWFGRDKALHFVASALVQTGTHLTLRSSGLSYADASRWAGAVTLGVGVGKELYDRADGRYFSWKDLAADAAGGVSAAVTLRQLDP
ncbi:MAG: hypothetical protein KF709_09860 [Gemmatimonadaceae bacterium]|nr:hypothetical protein [Gemmatimonadaceae bacterium]